MLTCCINSKAYFLLEQMTNTLKNFFSIPRNEDFIFIYWLSFGIFCVSCCPLVNTNFTRVIFLEYLVDLCLLQVQRHMKPDNTDVGWREALENVE